MKKFRVLFCFSFVVLAAPWQSGCKKSEDVAAISYKMRLEYHPAERVISGEEEIRFNVTSDGVFDCLKFYLYPNAFREGAAISPVSPVLADEAFYRGESFGGIEIKSAEIIGEESGEAWSVEGDDENILKIPLSSPIGKGESVRAKILFETTLPYANHRFGVSETTVNAGNFFPALCGVARNAEGGYFYEPSGGCVGDPFVSDCADFSVELTLPNTYTAAVSGVCLGESAEEEKTKLIIEAKNARDFAFCAAENFKKCETSVNAGGRKISVVYYYTDDETPLSVREISAKALAYYAEAYGEYPYETYCVAESGLCFGGMEYSSLTMLARGLEEEEKIYVAAHEAAHQWWYAAVGSNQAEEAWQDEGLVEYSTACFFGEYAEYKKEKEDFALAAEKEYRAYYNVYARVFGQADTRMSRPLREYASDYEYRAIAYDKGATLFFVAEKALGKRVMEKALKRYYEDCKFSLATPADLIAAFEKAGADVSGLFASFLDGSAIV